MIAGPDSISIPFHEATSEDEAELLKEKNWRNV